MRSVERPAGHDMVEEHFQRLAQHNIVIVYFLCRVSHM